MKFIEQRLEGVFLIEPSPYIDERGMFRRHFCSREFAANGIANAVMQSNVSENPHAYTLRGFHYQEHPHGEGKTLSCLKGRIHDIVVDLRPESKTFREWVAFELTESNRLSLHIPPGCANAFMTLEDNCLIHYYCSEAYAPEAEKGVRFNDPSFNFEWPRNPDYISEKDMDIADF